MLGETIVAIATATGVGSIAIVRVSGPKAIEIANSITLGTELEPRKARLATLHDRDGEVIDQAIVLYFKSPHSFTGEDIVEFQCHGGVVVAREVLDTIVASGARLAEPGEFSKRAFLNGKIDLSKAEAIAKLIEAQSLQGARMLARQLKGELGDFVDKSRDEMLEMLAHSEVMIDYSQEDIPKDIIQNLIAKLEQMHLQMNHVVDISLRRRGMIDGFRVAIVGKPNVGKSSLLNSLLSYERAIVSDIAGTTRDTVEERVQIGSHTIRLIDTAGIRDDASDEIEQIGIGRSIESIKGADIIIALFDSSIPLDESDSIVLELIKHESNKEVIVALSKSDLPSNIDEDILGDREYHLEKSLASKNKTYQSYKVGILVHNDDDRVTLYEELKKEDCVKIVL